MQPQLTFLSPFPPCALSGNSRRPSVASRRQGQRRRVVRRGADHARLPGQGRLPAAVPAAGRVATLCARGARAHDRTGAAGHRRAHGRQHALAATGVQRHPGGVGQGRRGQVHHRRQPGVRVVTQRGARRHSGRGHLRPVAAHHGGARGWHPGASHRRRPHRAVRARRRQADEFWVHQPGPGHAARPDGGLHGDAVGAADALGRAGLPGGGHAARHRRRADHLGASAEGDGGGGGHHTAAPGVCRCRQGHPAAGQAGGAAHRRGGVDGLLRGTRHREAILPVRPGPRCAPVAGIRHREHVRGAADAGDQRRRRHRHPDHPHDARRQRRVPVL
eukprot:ctg_2149.g561